MATQPAVRFSFDLSELYQAEAEPGVVIEGPGTPLPEQAVEIRGRPRPRWLRPLLPVLGRAKPLRLEFRTAAAPGFGDHLARSLAAVYASASYSSGGTVVTWPGGLALGWGALEHIPPMAHQVVVACDLSEAAIEMALGLGASVPGCWLVVNGDVPEAVHRWLPKTGPQVLALPLLGARQLAMEARGRAAALGDRAYGSDCAGLAAAILRAHLRGEP